MCDRNSGYISEKWNIFQSNLTSNSMLAAKAVNMAENIEMAHGLNHTLRKFFNQK